MIPDAKQIAKAIVGAKQPDGSGNGSARDDLEAAAGNILSASKSGDSKELASSLKEFMALCKEDD